MTEEKEIAPQTGAEKAKRTSSSGKQSGSAELDKKELTLRYLAALIQYAEWIPEGYKKLVVKGSTLELLRELYLCACDRVPLEKVQEARNGEDAVKNLIKLRQEHLRKLVMKEQGQELADLQKRMVAAEKKLAEQEHMILNVPKSGTLSKKEAAEIYPQDKTKIKEAAKTTEKDKNSKVSVARSKQRNGYPIRQCKSQAVFLSKIIDDYDTEQLQFIMDCIEEGIPVKSISNFISPVLPVEVMRRLKEIEQKKGERSVWSRIEKLIRS